MAGLAGLIAAALIFTGCGKKETKVEDVKPIVLGVPTALGSIEGADSLRAVRLAVEEINAKGGVSVGGEKRPLRIEHIDTRDSEPGIPVHDALAAIERLITDKKPDAIVVSPFRSEVLLSSMDLISQYKVPTIITIAMTPEFEKKVQADYDNYKYFFRMGLNAPYLVQYLTQTMAHIGKEFGFNKVYIINQDVLWAKGTSNGLKAWFEKNGWEVVGHDAYATGAQDFSASLTRARQANVELIVPIFDMPQAGILLKQIKSMQVKALLAGFISPAAAANAWDTFEGDVEGLINFVFEIGNMPVKAVPKSAAFFDNYGKMHGADNQLKLSGHGPAPSYDAVYVLVDAIERAGSLDPDAIVEALKKTDMQGAIGRIKFNENHQVIYGVDPKETAIGAAFQWQAPGVRVPVFPEVAAEGKIILP
jgi:branched-chain amino acid transport system substrate-binding protein